MGAIPQWGKLKRSPYKKNRSQYISCLRDNIITELRDTLPADAEFDSMSKTIEVFVTLYLSAYLGYTRYKYR